MITGIGCRNKVLFKIGKKDVTLAAGLSLVSSLLGAMVAAVIRCCYALSLSLYRYGRRRSQPDDDREEAIDDSDDATRAVLSAIAIKQAILEFSKFELE